MEQFSIQKNLVISDVVLPDDATVSPAIPLGGLTLCGLQLPAGVVSTALTFQASDAIAGIYVPVTKQDGTAISYTVAASKFVSIDPALFQGISFLKLVFGTAESGGPLTLKVSMKGI